MKDAKRMHAQEQLRTYEAVLLAMRGDSSECSNFVARKRREAGDET